MNIDSDNNNGLGWPDNSVLEELLEDHPYALGKLVMQNHNCTNPAASFTPIQIRLPKELDQSLKIRIDFSSWSKAGEINIWKKDKNTFQLADKITPGSTYTLADLNYNSTTGGITLYVAGFAQCSLKQWADVEREGRPDAFIKATFIVGDQDICSDQVKYIVVQDPSFFYRLQFGKGNEIGLYLRCLLASKYVYDREDLKRFCMKRLNQQELLDLGIPLPVAGWLAPANIQGSTPQGVKVALYEDYISQRYILTFAGTDDPEDVIEDIWQGLGNKFTPQYEDAMSIVDVLMNNVNVANVVKDNLICTGHSLGGGLASAASVVGGISAITFNAAGLHRNTLNNAPDGPPNDLGQVRRAAFQRFDNNGSGLIKAYYVDYDLLTQVQETFAPLIPKAIGMPYKLISDQGISAIVGAAALKAARILAIIPSLHSVILGATGFALSAYPGILCHSTDRLLYGFLVKKGLQGIEENLLKEPPIFPLQ